MIGRVSVLIALVLWMPVRTLAQDAPDMFKDVPRDNWAYEAIDSLRVKGFLIGYPDSYFRGKRTLSRYEFAVALDRALLRALGEPRGVPGSPPAQSGLTVFQGAARLVLDDVTTLRRLISEFRAELASLGNNLQTVNRRVDQLARESTEARAAAERMPRLSGGAFTGVKTNVGDANDVNKDTRVNRPGFRGSELHELRLGLATNLAGASTLSTALNGAGYRNFIGGNIGQFSQAPQGIDLGPATGHYSGSLNSAIPAESYLNLLEIRAPLRGIGRESNLTIGRFNQQLGRSALQRPEVDSYFSLPWHEDGQLRMNGARLNTSFGSLAVEAFGGQTTSVRSANSGPINSPQVGNGADSVGAQFLGVGSKRNSQPTVNQLAGFSVGVGVRQLEGGHVRLSAVELAGSNSAGLNGVHALGADVSLRLTNRLSLMGDWGKTIAHSSRTDTANPSFNNAFNAAVRYDVGSLNLTAGYRYVDPNFYAPAYWGRIGGWLNPTNIAGPTVRAAWDITPRFAINVGGEVFSAARDRAARGGLGESDTITRALVGIRWNLSRSLETTLDWEGVYWDLEGANGFTGGMVPSLFMPGAGRVNPTEQYFTLGTGYSLTNTARLRLLYQIGTYDGKGLLLNGAGLGARNTFNLFTGQVAVRF